jgi:hypothetical protein
LKDNAANKNMYGQEQFKEKTFVKKAVENMWSEIWSEINQIQNSLSGTMEPKNAVVHHDSS